MAKKVTRDKKVIWFKAKPYGWGWYPSTWQGWAILAGFIFISVCDYYRIASTSQSDRDIIVNFIPSIFLYSIILIIICYLTGEKPRWRWGNK
ncbi:MAG: hypothetical protein AAB909_01945 [Patescibacteria group bacterium]